VVDGVIVMLGPTAMPVPVRVTTCGELAALSAMLSVPVRVPAAVGVNTTLMSHFDVGVSGVATTQAGLALPATTTAKSPVGVRAEKAKFAFPVFVTVTVWTELVSATSVAGNVSDMADSETCGAVASAWHSPATIPGFEPLEEIVLNEHPEAT